MPKVQVDLKVVARALAVLKAVAVAKVHQALVKSHQTLSQVVFLILQKEVALVVETLNLDPIHHQRIMIHPAVVKAQLVVVLGGTPQVVEETITEIHGLDYLSS